MAGTWRTFWAVVIFLVPSIASFQPFRPRTFVFPVASLFLSNNKRIPSASEKERRDEEERRRRRKDDVVIGKTSAKQGEKDFALDPQATEREYLRQASFLEQEVYRWTGVGMEFLNSLQLDRADKAFSRVFELKPNAYLWQAGVVKFYLGDLVGAGKILAKAAETYETRFGCPATEERIWRDACELMYLNYTIKDLKRDPEQSESISSAIPTIKDIEATDGGIVESRKVLKLARDLFSSSIQSDKSGELLARAKLRSVGGSDGSARMDYKMWKLSAWFYLGLHYDVLGNVEESKKCMKMALKFSPSIGKSDNLVHTLPLLHMTVRDWFDDDDFDADINFDDCDKSQGVSFSPVPPNQAIASMAYSDPLIENSIKEGVSKMKSRELKDALRLRGKITTGSKEQLQERLFHSLMDDAGFASGFAP